MEDKSTRGSPESSFDRLDRISLAAGSFLRLLLAALALSAPAALQFPDDYLGIARRWIAAGRLDEAVFGPVYISICAAADLACGSGAVVAIVVLQALLAIATMLLIRPLVSALGLPRAAASASLVLVAIDPLLLVSAPTVLSETVYTFIFLAASVLLLRQRAAARPAAVFASGLLFGAAILTRSVGVVAAPVILALPFSFDARTRRRLFAAAALAAGILLPLTLWSARNARRYGAFRPTGSAGLNFALLVVGPAKSQSEGKPAEANPEVWNDLVDAERLRKNPLEAEGAYAHAAADWARKHPGALVRALVASQSRVWIAPWRAAWDRVVGHGSPTPASRAASLIAVVIRSAVTIAAIASLGILTRKRQWRLLALLGLIPLLHVAAAGSAAYGRFAVPVSPYVDCLAAISIAAIAARYRTLPAEPAR